MNTYILIPQDWAETMNGKQVDDFIFNSTLTVDGNCVCAENQFSIFSEDFSLLAETGWVKEVVTLGVDDFPLPDNSLFQK